MRAAVLPLFLLAACATPTTVEYLGKQKGYVAHSGHVFKMTLASPKVKKLKDGTAYTVTTEGGSVMIYNIRRDARGKRREERTFELKPGDIFVNAQPLSYVLIQQ
ncbi:MAG: hypothetical protein ACYS0E_05995 [Planctomycetota bacterium]|jgi:hypothetical protein